MADISSPNLRRIMRTHISPIIPIAIATSVVFAAVNYKVATTQQQESAENALRDLASRIESKNNCDMRSFNNQQISWAAQDLMGHKKSGTATTKKIVGENIARDESSNVHISYNIQAVDDQPDHNFFAQAGSHATYSTTYTLTPPCADAKIDKTIIKNFMPRAG